MTTLYRVEETTYEDGSYWITYDLTDNIYSYELFTPTEIDPTFNPQTDDVTPLAERYLQSLNPATLANKPQLETCSDFMQDLINETKQSQNEMWYVDPEMAEDDGITDEKIEELQQEIEQLGIENYFEFGDGSLGEDVIIVFGGAITRFNYEC